VGTPLLRSDPSAVRGGADSALPLIRGSWRGLGLSYFKLHLAGSIRPKMALGIRCLGIQFAPIILIIILFIILHKSHYIDDYLKELTCILSA
jgi:hypothetical protein